MKKLLLFVLLLFCLNTFGQLKEASYYLGKTFVVKPKEKVLQSFGYISFFIDRNKPVYFNLKNIAFRQKHGQHSEYDSLANRVFKCTEVVEENITNSSQYFFKLNNPQLGTVYYLGWAMYLDNTFDIPEEDDNNQSSKYSNSELLAKENTYKKNTVSPKSRVRPKISVPSLLYYGIQHLEGEEYYLLPPYKSITKYGYLSKGYDKVDVINSTNVSYDDMKYKILRLDYTELYYDREKIGHFSDADGVKYVKSTYNSAFTNMVPVREVDNASTWFLNKTLWLKLNYIKPYDTIAQKYSAAQSVRLEPVTVINIMLSNNENTPLKFILKTSDGSIGYLDVGIQGYNGFPTTKSNGMFEECFYLKDPKEGNKYTPAMWAFLKRGGVKLGMSRNALLLSQGNPSKVNTTTGSFGVHEQWVYGDAKYYYFENGKLTSIQN